MAPRVVVIVDHNDDSRIVYSAILRHSGFIVLTARDGAEALAMIPEQMPAVVITELALAVFDGCEVLQRLKRDPATCHIPVLVVTAESGPEFRQRAREAGCDAFISKPCAPLELLRATRAVLDSLMLPPLA